MKSFKHWVFLSFLLLSLNLMGQDKWTLEFKPGLNFPSTDIGATSLETGFGFELIGAYSLSPQFDVYAASGWNQFTTKETLINGESDVKETGFSLGLKFKDPFLNFAKTSYVLNVGGIYNNLEVEDRLNETSGDTGYGLGWQASVGLEYLIAENWSLRPELRYRSLSNDLTYMNITEKIDHRYFSFGLGLAVSF